MYERVVVAAAQQKRGVVERILFFTKKMRPRKTLKKKLQYPMSNQKHPSLHAAFSFSLPTVQASFPLKFPFQTFALCVCARVWMRNRDECKKKLIYNIQYTLLNKSHDPIGTISEHSQFDSL